MVEDLAYDLRQKYAEIVGIHLEAVSLARINKNYPDYYQALEDLFTVVKHKIKTKKTSGEEEEDYEPTFIKRDGKKTPEKKTDLERYYALRQNAIDKANEYSTVYFGTTFDPKQVGELEKAFRELEMFLFYAMDRSNMFGKMGYNEGM